MNPSRIGTPIFKEIDTWHFKVEDKVVVFDVFLQRSRDFQVYADGSNYDGKNRPMPKHLFVASVSRETRSDAVMSKCFSQSDRLEDQDFAALRDKAAAHALLASVRVWTKVIIVGFEMHEQTDGEKIGGITVGNSYSPSMKFNFAVAEQSGEFFREGPDRYMHSSPSRLIPSWFGDGSYNILPYSEELETQLTDFKTKFETFGVRLSEFLMNKQLMDFLPKLLPPVSSST